VEIINNIIDLSKIEAGRVTLEETEVILDGITADIAAMLAPSIEVKHLQLSVDKLPMAYRLIGDPTRLKQALLNYASNGVKFTEQGQITLRTLKLDESPNDVLVRFEVEDTGVGINPELADRHVPCF